MTKTTSQTKAKPKPPETDDTAQIALEVAAAAPTAPKGKIGAVVDLLKRSSGASIAELMTATGWQAHSVRGAMSGAVKTKLGLTVTSDKVDGVRRYNITADAEAGA